MHAAQRVCNIPWPEHLGLGRQRRLGTLLALERLRGIRTFRSMLPQRNSLFMLPFFIATSEPTLPSSAAVTWHTHCYMAMRPLVGIITLLDKLPSLRACMFSHRAATIAMLLCPLPSTAYTPKRSALDESSYIGNSRDATSGTIDLAHTL